MCVSGGFFGMLMSSILFVLSVMNVVMLVSSCVMGCISVDVFVCCLILLLMCMVILSVLVLGILL